ncbi:MAG: SurA N-terminal domain-containing protein [Rubritalea sp.]
MRKYTGLMVVVLVLLAAGLVLTMKPGGSGGGAGNQFMQVNDIALDQNDFSKAGKNTILAIERLAQLQNYNDYFKFREFVGTLTGNATSETQSQLNFVTNRILLKQAAEKLGLYSAPEAAQKYILDTMFKGRDGSHDPELYSSYIASLGNRGLKEKDFQQLVAEYIVFTKTRDLIGGGLTPSKAITISEDKLSRQDIGMNVVSFKLTDFEKTITPSEDEIKSYWETHKNKYKTERKLKLTYVLTNLEDSSEPKRPTPAADADPTEASKKNLEYQEKHVKWTEQRKSHTKILTKIFSDFVDQVQDSEGKDFDQAAAAAKEEAGEDFTIVKTEAFTIDNAPEELKRLSLKNYPQGTQLVSLIFAKQFNPDDIYHNFDNFTVGRDGNIAIRLDEDVQPQVKTYAEAADDAKADLIAKRGVEAMITAAKDAKTTLTAAVSDSKSFVDAAKEAKFTVTELTPFNATTPPADVANAADFFRIAQTTAPKTVANKLSTSDDSASIIYVTTRTLTVQGDEALKETQLLEQAANDLKYWVFNAWINGLKEQANANGQLKLPNAQ